MENAASEVLGGPSSENHPRAKGQTSGIFLRALNTKNNGRGSVASILPSSMDSLQRGGGGPSPITQENPRALDLAFRNREGLGKALGIEKG